MSRRRSNRWETPEVRERRRIVRLAYAMSPTEMRRWERQTAETVERMETYGWRDADFAQLGRLREEMERRHELTPEESLMATRVIQPGLLLDFAHWTALCSPADTPAAAEYIYRTYARLPVDTEIIERMRPGELVDPEED